MDFLSGIWEAFAGALMEVLPTSPFKDFIEGVGSIEYLGMLNWFFPVGPCLAVMAAWLGMVGLFYLYSIVMRWIKAIGS